MTKYKQVYRDILHNIENDLYENKLPSEKKLADDYQVSINTLRKALSILVDNGYIISRHGSGYYLSNHKNFNSLKLKSLGNTYQHKDITSRIIHFKIIQADAVEARNLNVALGTAIFSIKRLRLIDKKPYILENTIIPVSLFPTINAEVFSGSFYEYIRKETSHRIKRAYKDISTEYPNADLCKIFKLKEPRPLLVIENYVYFSDGTQFEYSYNIHLDKKLSLAVNVENL